ncbi:hypothetical protein DFR52_10646 [Hoeflea marina]|uniref:CREG-like beta-barrel domain-containing protein n=1 Tax=Hoeflea marina TaxID=274592 RepID=A0A317PHK4_9HYPH|nr:pyridoxamine 5'-phosphate oxidase family protein [Hoeflea marina]PWV97523.1 hypothetical protein DFR52_10646 [Hoeflea marina]
MKDPVRTLRDTDEDARRLARRLVRGSRRAAIAVLEPETGFPFSSRVLTGTDVDGVPVILVSALAVHSAALRADPRASMMFGQAGKGDPLAHARITVRCQAAAVDRGHPDHGRIRRRFIARHPKSALYADFGDFAFFRMEPVTALLNGGFGKAYALDRDDLVISSPALTAMPAIEEELLRAIAMEHSAAGDVCASVCGGSKKAGWRIFAIDPAGVDLSNGDDLLRIEFDNTVPNAEDLPRVFSDILMKPRII